MLIVISVFAIYGISDLYVDYSLTANKEYMENATAITQLPGTYTSTDGKTITVAEDGTTKYLDTYTLTVTESATGNVLSGKVGTNNKAATFYQLNDKSLVSSTSMNYTTAEGTIYLYDHTVFTTTKTVSPDQTGAFELWRENSKVNTYKTLQDAVDSASSGDTIKITKDLVVTEGTYINKNITIEGNNHTLDKSKWYNPAIVVEEGAILNINNLTIDGGAKNFEVDFSLAYPKIKTGTLELDPKANISSIISKGTLNADKVNMNNHYTTGNGSAMKIIRGNGKITNCNFNHNYAGPEGAAIYIGSQPRVGETTFPAKNIYIDNCDFTYNYSVLSGSVAGGAAIAVNWTEKIDVKNSYAFGDGYNDVDRQLKERFGIEYVAITLRSSISANDNDWAAMLYDGKECYFSRQYRMHIVDRVGGGDSFGAGLIYSMLEGKSAQDTIEFAVAASCLKHSVEGDYNMMSVAEVESLAGGNASGRVQR